MSPPAASPERSWPAATAGASRATAPPASHGGRLQFSGASARAGQCVARARTCLTCCAPNCPRRWGTTRNNRSQPARAPRRHVDVHQWGHPRDQPAPNRRDPSTRRAERDESAGPCGGPHHPGSIPGGPERRRSPRITRHGRGTNQTGTPRDDRQPTGAARRTTTRPRPACNASSDKPATPPSTQPTRAPRVGGLATDRRPTGADPNHRTPSPHNSPPGRGTPSPHQHPATGRGTEGAAPRGPRVSGPPRDRGRAQWDSAFGLSAPTDT